MCTQKRKTKTLTKTYTHCYMYNIIQREICALKNENTKTQHYYDMRTEKLKRKKINNQKSKIKKLRN